MQKSNTGERSIEPATAPVSETAKTQAQKAPVAETQARASAPTDATATPAQTSTQAEAATGKIASAPEGSATTISSEEVSSAKRELAADEARIKELHEEKEMANRRMAEEAAKQQAQEAAVTSPEPGATATERPASRVVATKPDEPIAVFPTNRNVASNSATPTAIQQPLERSLYFDYDKSVIKDVYDSMLKANAEYLRSRPSTATEIQGNCDERGSREYNLALGARRAEAVKRALELLGADGSKIKTVSFGSEKPVALGKDEESYRKNRRADIVN